MDQSVKDEAISVAAGDDSLPEYRQDEVVAEQIPAQSRTFWQRLVSWVWPSPEERQQQTRQRLEDLNRAVESYPETPANYVLRGDLYLEMGEVERAADDFGRALGLAAAQVESDDWGMISQVMQDRALTGLASARRALGNTHAEHRQYDDF